MSAALRLRVSSAVLEYHALCPAGHNAWFFRNARQVMDGSLPLRSRYFQIVEVDTLYPKSARTFWIMGVPQKGLAREL